jgi:heptosyltransferase-2
VIYYLHAARALLDPAAPRTLTAERPAPIFPPGVRLELATTEAERTAAAALLQAARVRPGAPLAMLNPGGNNAAKRWPEDRFAAVAQRLHERGLTALINGAPAEAELVARIAQAAGVPCVQLPVLGNTLGTLKAILAERSAEGARCRVMVTNDTGPRHIAAAFGVPVVSLFGPTDHRWTTIPAGIETILLADPTLPADQVADDHPERCRVDRITLESVLAAVEAALKVRAAPPVVDAAARNPA